MASVGQVRRGFALMVDNIAGGGANTSSSGDAVVLNNVLQKMSLEVQWFRAGGKDCLCFGCMF